MKKMKQFGGYRVGVIKGIIHTYQGFIVDGLTRVHSHVHVMLRGSNGRCSDTRCFRSGSVNYSSPEVRN